MEYEIAAIGVWIVLFVDGEERMRVAKEHIFSVGLSQSLFGDEVAQQRVTVQAMGGAEECFDGVKYEDFISVLTGREIGVKGKYV